MPKPVDVRRKPRLSGEGEAGLNDPVELGRGRRPAELVFGVPGVARVEEDDAADADLVDDGELELEVLVGLEVAADVGAVGDGRRVRVERRRERQARADAAQVEAAHVEDAAEEVALEDRNALRVRARDEPDLGVELEDEARAGLTRAAAERVVEAPREPVAEVIELAAEGLARELRREPAGRCRDVGKRRLSRVS